DDLDATIADLTAKGLEFDPTMNNMPWGRYVSIQDPDGNGIALQTTTV
ncbi:MAG: VOC family protein, partial [Actinomycetes bacterium]